VFAAITAFFLVNTVAVSLAVASWYRENVLRAWARIAGASLVYDIVTSLLAPLLAFLYVKRQIPGILFLILPIYFVRHLYQVSLQLEQVNRDLLELMVKAIEARDPYTSGHSQRVSELAVSIARQLGLSSKAVDHIRTAALLHDVGKIYEEYAPLLRKEGKLNLTEKALMQTHPTRSAELVATISGFRGAIEQAVRHHHENYDGTGYPIGVSGEAIPLGARIIMIADTVDAMTTDRPYRKALSFEHVTQELERLSGKQFDPALVSIFLRSSRIREIVAMRVESQRDAQQSDQLDAVAAAGLQSPALLRPSWRARLSR
jgi:putative nucleotidyltransferase with HDIG domain